MRNRVDPGVSGLRDRGVGGFWICEVLNMLGPCFGQTVGFRRHVNTTPS